MSKWTPEEKALLRSLYPIKTAVQIAELMQKTPYQVRKQVVTMGLSKSNPGSTRPIGSERMDRGYLIRKVTDTGRPKKDWKRVEVIEWEEVNGPIPEGKMLMVINPSLPRTVSNMGLFTHMEHFDRMAVFNYPPELRKLCQLKGQITQAINRRINPKPKA